MHPRRVRSLLAVLSMTLPLVPGCFERSLGPVAPCTRSRLASSVQAEGVDQVDLLFMIDDSGSMEEEQQSIIDEIPRLVRVLTTGDRDEDGTADFDPVRSLHVAVVSSDMGTGLVGTVDSCAAGFGDDGVFRSRGVAACGESPLPPIFTFEGGDADAFAGAVGCVATLGTAGCNLEQQLDAMLKAVSFAPAVDGSSPVTWTAPGYRPPEFFGGTWGHGGPGGLNDGFLRPTSVLAVVLVTDEDDCSTPDTTIYDPNSTEYPADLNVRCHEAADRLYPVQRYVDGLVGLRQSPHLVVFGAITGVPLYAEGLDPAAILELPEMQEVVDPSDGVGLRSACTSVNGDAFPARRLVQTVRGLEAAGASATVRSICNETFTGAVDAIIERLRIAIGASECLPRALNPDVDGRVPCDVVEVLPPIGSGAEAEHCAELEGEGAFTFEGEETAFVNGHEVHRERCRVRQVARDEAGIVAGWFYDDGDPRLGDASDLPDPCRQRISFSASRPISGAEIRLVCDQTIVSGNGGPVQVGSICDPATSEVGEGLHCADGYATSGHPESTLSCDAFDRTCRLACESDADCARAGLLAYACDVQTAEQILGSSRPETIPRDRVHHFCVDPTCVYE